MSTSQPGSGALARRVLRLARDAVLIALLSFATSEVVLRAYTRLQPSYVFETTGYDRFRVQPGTLISGFRVNSRGFHDTEFGARSPGSRRLLFLGDSFAFGIVPYEFNVATVLERELSATGARAEVLNLGISRTSPSQHFALLLEEGLGLEPDAVMAAVYSGNDFTEELRRIDRKRFWQHSHVLSLVRYLFWVRPEIEFSSWENGEYVDSDATFTQKQYMEIVKRRAPVYWTEWSRFEEALERIVQSLARMSATCRDRGIDFFVVIFPEETQVDSQWQQRLLRQPRYTPENMDFGRPNRAVRERLEAEGIPVLDLTPAFIEDARLRPLYRRWDSHWNIAGNELAAREIGDFLIRGEGRGLLASREP